MSIIGQHLFPASAGALLVWLKENEPENYKNLGYMLACKDWIRTFITDTVGAVGSNSLTTVVRLSVVGVTLNEMGAGVSTALS